jgi:hypothetical protein
MQDDLLGNAPLNGKRVSILPGNIVEVWVNGKLTMTRKFPTREEAEQFQRKEVLR